MMFYTKRRLEIKNDRLLWRAATTKHEFFSVQVQVEQEMDDRSAAGVEVQRKGRVSVMLK